MQLAAIVKARTLAFIDIDELNKNGRVRLADIVPAIAKRYDFMTYPTKLEDFDIDDKGVTFSSDAWEKLLSMYSKFIRD